MLGWEFPPLYAGGVGMVCYELTRALSQHPDINLTYVMPHGPSELNYSGFRVIVTDNLKLKNVRIKKVRTLLRPYQTAKDYEEEYKNLIEADFSAGEDSPNTKLYGSNLLQEIVLFSHKLKQVLKLEDFDVIHAHDWTTFPAAIEAKKVTQKPLIVHIHITEFDKSGGQHADPTIYAIEKKGMETADCVIAVSNKIKDTLITIYGINPGKIKVVHNASVAMDDKKEIKKGLDEKVVLYAGRVTLQKGPEYFIEAAKKVADVEDKVLFVMAGTGDQLPRMIEKTINLGIAHKFSFTGFYTREDAEKLFSMADVFVMPSVSEPFGIVPMEAMIKGTPAIISKQSGCSEVLKNTFKIDFWDINEMANKILGLLKYKELNEFMGLNGRQEVKQLTWDRPALTIKNIYENLVR